MLFKKHVTDEIDHRAYNVMIQPAAGPQQHFGVSAHRNKNESCYQGSHRHHADRKIAERTNPSGFSPRQKQCDAGEKSSHIRQLCVEDEQFPLDMHNHSERP